MANSNYERLSPTTPIQFTVNTLVEMIARIQGWSWVNVGSLTNRDLHVVVCRANAGRATDAIFSLEGPNNRFTITMTNLDLPAQYRYLTVDGHRVLAHSKHTTICEMLEACLRGRNLI